MRELLIGIVCLVGAWIFFYKMLQISDWLAVGILILAGVIAGVACRNWAIGLLILHPVEIFAYREMLDRILIPYWRYPSWVDGLLFYGMPILPVAAAYLLSHSLSIVLLYLIPEGLSLFFWVAGICEQRTIQKLSSQDEW